MVYRDMSGKEGWRLVGGESGILEGRVDVREGGIHGRSGRVAFPLVKVVDDGLASAEAVVRPRRVPRAAVVDRRSAEDIVDLRW